MLRRLPLNLRPPRRLRVLRGGAFVIAGTLALGFATLNTGNNLLYLLFGALLGMIALSGWLSEQTLRGLAIRRTLPGSATAGTPVLITYSVTKRAGRLPTYDVELRESLTAPRSTRDVSVEPAYIFCLERGATRRVHGRVTASTRGVYELAGLSVATTFPFGLFRKERDIALPATLLVWPRTDRPVRAPATSGRRGRRSAEASALAASGARGEYRGLRAWRAGDDRRDIHWRSTARRGELIVREFDQDAADEYWIVLDTMSEDAAVAEMAIEVAAALIVRAARYGERCGLVTADACIAPDTIAGGAHALLDVLAGIDITRPNAASPPMPASSCVLVTARAPSAHPWGDVYHVTGL